MEDTEQEFTRPATPEDLKFLIQSLNDNDVDYFLIGGYALFAHGYVRTTTDIDILVPSELETGKKVKTALMVLPEKSAQYIDPNWFVDNNDDEFGNIRVSDEFPVDIMFNPCGETFKSLSSHIQIIDVDGVQIKTLDLEGLLKTKQTVRDKDIQDRIVLERAIEEIKKLQKNKSIKPK